MWFVRIILAARVKKCLDNRTYAYKDIAFEFASWASPQFKLYLIKEFERLKKQEQVLLGWSAKRELFMHLKQMC